MRNSRATIFLLAANLVGCATPGPTFLRETMPDNPTLSQVNAATANYTGQSVRWGGTIFKVENRAQETWIEIVERPLDAQGRPRNSDQSDGRFIVRIVRFLEPTIYTQGRVITVLGIVDGVNSGKIGDYDYAYPVVKTDAVHLWVQEISVRPPPDPYWYDPWYPFWPWPYRP